MGKRDSPIDDDGDDKNGGSIENSIVSSTEQLTATNVNVADNVITQPPLSAEQNNNNEHAVVDKKGEDTTARTNKDDRQTETTAAPIKAYLRVKPLEKLISVRYAQILNKRQVAAKRAPPPAPPKLRNAIKAKLVCSSSSEQEGAVTVSDPDSSTDTDDQIIYKRAVSLRNQSRKRVKPIFGSDSDSNGGNGEKTQRKEKQPCKRARYTASIKIDEVGARKTASSAVKVRRCCVRLKRVNIATLKMSEQEQEVATTSKRAAKLTSDSDSETEPEQAPGKSSSSSSSSSPDNSSDSSSSSDVEVLPQPKKRVFESSSRSVSKTPKTSKAKKSSEDSDFEPESKKSNKKKRKRVATQSSSDEGSGDSVDENGKRKRKQIRKIIKTKDLDVSTKTAAKEEEDRRQRIIERQKLYNQIFEKPENVEQDELVLDFDENSKKVLLQVDKGLLKKLKPHQVTGVKFMWEACFESIKELEDNQPGSGCILAHCMGLGKTLQIVALAHTLLSNKHRTGVERVLIISPLSTLNNWAREFVQWMKYAKKRDIEIYDVSRYKDKQTRIFKISEWFEEGGVCIMGYDMYRILANEKAKGLRKKQRERLQEALVDPGPDLVVCDEGHLLKNEKTSLSKAVTRMRTRRRIVLTGTPLQNNLKEYYCMIQFIKPNLLGTYKEYMNRFVNPITNGQYTDSTDRDIRLMKHRSHILHKMLEGCIQRRDYSVLAPYLPPKHEYVVYCQLSDLQQHLYEHYMTVQREVTSSDISGKGARLFQDFQDLRRIWTHPMNLRVNSDTVIAKRIQKDEEEGSDLDGFICDESDSESSSSSDSDVDSNGSCVIAGSSRRNGAAKKQRTTRNTAGEVLEDDSDDVVFVQKDDPSEWWKRFVEDKELNNIHHSPKLVILMQLLQQCEVIGDKLLVFSQSLQSLDVIEHFLGLIDNKTKGYEYEGDIGDFKGSWTPGEDYFRLDGTCSVESREAMCKKFNNVTNLRARLFLISTRAGGLGINLVAANRVVIFDVSWNPSHDTQSIFRVYRFGQTKPCYIYRLIAMGTMEQKVYERQVAKQATAKRVIDEQQIGRHYNQTDLMELYTYDLMPTTEREVPILPKDRLFAELLSSFEQYIFKYHEHDSLLEQEESENLSESERKAAWAEYEAEKTRPVQAAQYIAYDRNAYGPQFGNASGSVTTNKIFGFRSDILLQLLSMKVAKDHPSWGPAQITNEVPRALQTLYTEMNSGNPEMYKELLNLHTTVVHSSGMYMNPLLYANQNPSAAGYFQTPGAPGASTIQQQPGLVAPAPRAPGFDPNEIYEID